MPISAKSHRKHVRRSNFARYPRKLHTRLLKFLSREAARLSLPTTRGLGPRALRDTYQELGPNTSDDVLAAATPADAGVLFFSGLSLVFLVGSVIRSTGDWSADGVTPGTKLRIDGSTSNDGDVVVASITTTTNPNDTLVWTDTAFGATEGPTSTPTLISLDPDGVERP